MKLSIVVPACNEEKRIGRMLDAYLPYFGARYGKEVEFIVVVNGSTDRTAGIVADYAAQNGIVRVIVEPGRVGKGGALALGFRQATGALIGFADADGSTPPEAFDDLVRRAGTNDAVIASRWAPGAQVSPRQPLLRLAASRCFNLITRMLFGLRFADTQCGAKIVKCEALRTVLPMLGASRWAFDVDLLFQLKRHGFHIEEAPTVWHDVAGSKVVMSQTPFDMVFALTRLRLFNSPLRCLVRFYDNRLVPFVHPEGLEQDRLLRHALLLMGSSQAANLLDGITIIVLFRLLSDEQCGIMVAMLSLASLLVRPLGAFGQTISQFTAMMIREGRKSDIGSLLGSMSVDLTIVFLAVTLGMWAGLDRLVGFFGLNSAVPLVLVVLTTGFSIYALIPGGALAGAQAFGWTSAVNVGKNVVRLALVTCLALATGTAAGVLSAHVLHLAFGLALAFVGCRHALGLRRLGYARIKGAYSYTGRYILSLAGRVLMLEAGILMGKHFLPPDEAGRFAKVLSAAKMSLLAAAPIAAAMFPKVASMGRTSYANWRTLQKAVIVSLVTGIGAALAVTLFAPLVLRILTGMRSVEGAVLLRWAVWSFVPMALIGTLVEFEAAQRRFLVTVPLLLCAACYIGGVFLFWRGSTLHMVWALGGAGWILAAVLTMMFFMRSSQWRAAAEEHRRSLA